MTSVQHAIHYHLSTDADVEQLLEEMARIDAPTIVVAFDSTDEFTTTDLQLARLVAAARDHRKRLIVESADRELNQRAMRIGFNDLAIVSDGPRLNLSGTGVIPAVLVSNPNEKSRTRFNTTADLATYRPDTIPVAGESDDSNDADPDDYQAGQTSATEAVTRVFDVTWADSEPVATTNGQTGDQFGGRRIDTPQIAPSAVAQSRRPGAIPHSRDTYDEWEDRARARPKPRQKSRRRKGVILAAAILAPILVVGVIAALAVYLLPTANVSIVPIEDSISSSLTYGLQTAGASYDIAIDPELITSESSAEASRDATGERFEPDGTASGLIQITNPFTSDVTVPSGTDITAGNGVTYYTSEDVTIPAADPFGSLSFGSSSVGVYAGVAGPDGNLDAGSLTGQLGTGLFYTNPSSISGGTMRSISVIEEADVEAVTAEVESALLDRAEREFLATIPNDLELVPGSIEIGDPEIEVIGEAGVDGQEVSASGKISVRGQVFDPEELHEQALDEASRLLASQGGSERIVIASSVSIADPEPLNDDGTAFTVRADGTARTVISDEERQEIIDQLVGLSRADAEAFLSQHPKIESFDLSIAPDWLPDRLPEIKSRIELHVSSSGQPTASR